MNTRHENKANFQIDEEKLNCGENPSGQENPDRQSSQEQSEEELEQIRQMGSLTMESKEIGRAHV